MPDEKDWVDWRNQQRRHLINKRQILTPSQRDDVEQKIQSQLLDFLLPLPAGIISFYIPIKGEINCQPLIEALLAKGWQAALPKIIAKDTALEFRLWQPDCVMAPETWRIPVPQNTELAVPNVLLIPLVGFDQYGHRLGNGGGFYDRSLAAIQPKPLAIGVGLESLKLDDIEAQPHDIAMDYVVTEQTIYSSQH
ncbi:5-formyltetrahydrofolate cyclo-ligase [Methylophaga sp. OBS3]|uniref:5-formyltetrahydrofolate cyclo-ligase n=1 Tax=Methylophaga sp. OBS3 TaxID=2991934 RepID=UPI002253B7C7|nr:5-formyltetrahydrofolate cyclo-ligase [Methylophaga sp. OBS3]MCX4189671.1 5-formyltetrahydrofolate cyclo-ligase [Methylophaga sp. OBS3]